jgi:GNAT superfamily N-acetyltransferase
METEIRKIHVGELNLIQKIAYKTWPSTFASILSSEQIDYMLDWMYSLDKLKVQIKNGHDFYVFFSENESVGFIGVELNTSINSLKIHKLYVLPNQQGKRIGQQLIAFVEHVYSCQKIYLNVNRFNAAVEFYFKLGFVIEREENIDIGNGYLMEDFVMRKDL